MTVRVKKTKNLDGLKKLIESSRAIEKTAVMFGSMGHNGSESPIHPNADGMSVAELQKIHEFGLGVPERSVIRKVSNGERHELMVAVKDGLREAIKGRPDAAATHVGERAEELLHDALDLVQPPLSEATLSKPERAGVDPLQDTGTLRENLRWAKLRR